MDIICALFGNFTCRIHQDGTLEISSVQFSDFGRYKCKAENIDRARTSKVADLTQNGDICKHCPQNNYFSLPPAIFNDLTFWPVLLSFCFVDFMCRLYFPLSV